VASLRFLDPACGCGNFLVITYRELRLLELAILKELQRGQMVSDISALVLCDVDRFYGIEYEEFPAQIAQVALWLTDHQMNMRVSAEFGEYFVRLPLVKSAKITHGNSLQIDWGSLVEPLPWESSTKFDYILGNPPFVGKQLQGPEQKADMEAIFIGVHGAGVLDYVTAWYIKAAKYLQEYNSEETNNEKKTRVAFVSTNSIAQGEQVGILWNELFNHYKIKIHFAHRTFKWGNEARANAAVHVVIIVFSDFDIAEKRIFEYENISGEPQELKVKNINPYLVGGKDFVILSRKQCISHVPEMFKGSQPTDGGFLLLTDIEKIELINNEPIASKFILPFISAREFLHNEKRWCIWLVNANPSELNQCTNILKRLEEVKSFRLKSTKASTVKWAKNPGLFTENRQPISNYILLPRHSSENRNYIPIGFFSAENIVADSCNSIPEATIFHFGIISSLMHIVWIRYVCGRIKSDFRYSNDIVYNNFPWPENPSEKQKETIETAAQKVLDTRAEFPGSSLAVLYSPLTMPPALVKAHNDLDKAVDLAYRPQLFANETKRIEYLFELYDKYTAGLFQKNRQHR
jgi:hypothetical protein